MKRPFYRSDFQAMDFALADEQRYRLGAKVIGGGAITLAAAAGVEVIYDAPEYVALSVSSGILFAGAAVLGAMAAYKRKSFNLLTEAVKYDWAEFFTPSSGVTEEGVHLEYPSAIPTSAYEVAGEIQ